MGGIGNRLAGPRRAVLGGLAGSAAASFGGIARAAGPGFARPPLVPMRLTRDQLIDVKCCIRPLRAAGPNLSTEIVGDRLIIHNYGHGGSGWSLSWGCAEVAVGKAMSVLPTSIAVVGCGIIGLTSAIMAQRAGLKVTIYARELLLRTRSFRASGSFTPGSRIALTVPAGPKFADEWEAMARFSWKMMRTYLGLPGKAVEFADSYAVSDKPITRRVWTPDPAITTAWTPGGLPLQHTEFAHLDERIRDIVPQSAPVPAEENPFATPYVNRTSQMHFNFTSYAQVMLQEFFERGGRYVIRNFHSPAELARLPEKVVIHATGYAARDLWRDNTVIPVRGQTGWLVPQTEANYAVRMGPYLAMSKADGVVIMNNSPVEMGDMLGVGDSTELPDPGPIEQAMATLAGVFAPRAAGGAA